MRIHTVEIPCVGILAIGSLASQLVVLAYEVCMPSFPLALVNLHTPVLHTDQRHLCWHDAIMEQGPRTLRRDLGVTGHLQFVLKFHADLPSDAAVESVVPPLCRIVLVRLYVFTHVLEVGLVGVQACQ